MTAAPLSLLADPEVAAAFQAICGRFGVRRLDLFGSALTERFDPARSDLDFLVAFGTDVPGTLFSAYFGLKEELERLFGRTVDLVAEDGIANPYFRREVEKSRRPVFPVA